MKIRKSTVALMAALSMFATGCSVADTSSTEAALHFTGGIGTDREFQGCVDPSSKQYDRPGATHYVYPIDLRSFDATGGERSESGPIEVVSNEGERLNVPITVSFYLKPDCENLLAFHNTLGDKYNAYNDNGEVSEGWVKGMLPYAVGQPLNTTLDRVAQTHGWRDLYNNEALRADIEAQIAKSLPGLIANQSGGQQFFERFQVTMQKPTPVNPELLTAISAQQAAIEQGKAVSAKADAEKAAAEAQAAAANAQVATEQANAAKRQAEIAGYGSVEEYNRAKAIEKGINPYQPTYVVPQGG